MKRLALTCMLLVIPCSADVIYVKEGGTGSGTSWEDPNGVLQIAINNANSNDEVWVAAGTYKPTMKVGGSGDRYKTFQMKNGVAIYGGFPPGGDTFANRDPNRYESILSGDLNRNDGPGKWENNEENSYHVVTGSGTDQNTVLDGFTITAGNANGSYPHYYGGGMRNSSGSPTVANCIFAGNNSYQDGAGMFNYQSNPTVTNCTFMNNLARDDGGGMINKYNSNPILTNCTFNSNSADFGGGIHNLDSNPTVKNCAFTANLARVGGGMSNDSSNPIVTGCTFSGNEAKWGGGITNWYSSLEADNCTFNANIADVGGGMRNINSNPRLTNCTFSGNSAGQDGGGIYNYESNPILKSCIINNNEAFDSDGGGIYCEDSSPELSNCTISENSADYYGGGIHCVFNYKSKPTILNCNISKNSATIGGGVTFSDGLFSNCTITGNMAIEGGGLTGCSGTITSCYITRNTGMMGGGLKHCDGVISNCIISANNEGGGLFACFGLIVNCTIIGNSTNAMSGGGLFACRGTIANCIIWANRAKGGHLSQYASCSTPVSSCVQEGCDEGVCISSDPCFIQPGYWDEDIWVDGDYHLQPTSPCIDTGDNSVVDPNSVDLDGNERIINGIVDMGAYEALLSIEADVYIVPRVINRRSRMKRVMAIIRLPEGIGKGDVVRESFELYAGGLDSEPIGAIWERVIGWGNMTRVFALFDKGELMDAVEGVGRPELTVVGRLESGQCIYGSDTVRIVQPRRRPRKRLKLR